MITLPLCTLRSTSLFLMVLLISACQSQELVQPVDFHAGSHAIEFNHNNIPRKALLYVPEQSVGKASPVLVTLHGSGSNGDQFLMETNFMKHANAHGYLVLAPDGRNGFFNDGSPRSINARFANDTDYIFELVERIEASALVDQNRIFLVGFDNGGSMAQKVMHDPDHPFAGVVVVSAHPWFKPETPARPVPLLMIFGAEDPVNPLTGGYHRNRWGNLMQKPPQIKSVKYWTRKFRCVTGVRSQMGVLKQAGWYGCDDNIRVLYYQIQGLGHFWPGGRLTRYIGVSSVMVGPYQGRINATSLAWDFFKDINPSPDTAQVSQTP